MVRSARTSKLSGEILEKCPTGIAGFDVITGGGLPKGRPSLVCGSAGCGKTVFGAEFLARSEQIMSCRRSSRKPRSRSSGSSGTSRIPKRY